MFVVLAGLGCITAASDQGTLAVSSRDGSVTVTIDRGQAAITSVSTNKGGLAYDLLVVPGIEGSRLLTSSVTDNGAEGVLIQSFLCLPGGDVPCAPQKAAFNVSIEPSDTSVRVNCAIEGGMDEGVAAWTAPISLGFNFSGSNKLKLWAPWNRGTLDALLPSDGGYSWWVGEYAFGNSLGSPDFVVAEHFSVINPVSGALHVIGDPGNPPVPRGWLKLDGQGGAKCVTPADCPGQASAMFSYEMLRLLPGVVHTRSFNFVGGAPCYRPGLAWSLLTYPEFWSPVHGAASRFVDGLGSYSSYLGELSDPKWKQMGYQTNWDLSGRFFPYMGMFLPPMSSSTETWENDKEGTQTRANCSFDSIDNNYAMIQGEGFSTLSYFNVFEYGINVVHGQDRGTVPATLNQANWPNASQYLADNFRPALVTNFACAGGSPCNSKEWIPVEGSSQGSWQGSVVVDPREGLGYDVSLLSQIRRKLSQLPHFQGIVIDRSDWNQMVNLDGDDGYTLVQNRTGWSMKHSYLQILPKVRAELDRAQALRAGGSQPYVMLDNTVGFAWLPFMKSFDGTYSEGSNVNAVGILGLDSTSILWTYDAKACCSTPAAADIFFQTHLRMGVFPQAPFPLNDHCIQPDPTSTAEYIRYGALFTAIRNATWFLAPSPIKAFSPAIKTNAFRGGVDGTDFLYPIVFGANATLTSVTLTSLPTSLDGLKADVLHPGLGAPWLEVALSPTTNGVSASVPLVSGCGLLRIQKSS